MSFIFSYSFLDIFLKKILGFFDFVEDVNCFRYAQNEIRFNLLAVVESKDVKAKQQIADLKKNKGKIYNQLQEIQGENFNQETFQDFNECVKN